MVQVWKEEQTLSQRQNRCWTHCWSLTSAAVLSVLVLPCTPAQPDWLLWIELFTSAWQAAALNYVKAAHRVADKTSTVRGSEVRDSSSLTVKTTRLFILLSNFACERQHWCRWISYVFVKMCSSEDCNWQTVSYGYYFSSTSDGLQSWLIISDPSHWAVTLSLIKSLHLV